MPHHLLCDTQTHFFPIYLKFSWDRGIFLSYSLGLLATSPLQALKKHFCMNKWITITYKTFCPLTPSYLYGLISSFSSNKSCVPATWNPLLLFTNMENFIALRFCLCFSCHLFLNNQLYHPGQVNPGNELILDLFTFILSSAQQTSTEHMVCVRHSYKFGDRDLWTKRQCHGPPGTYMLV